MGGASTMGKGKSQCARTGSQSPSDEEIPVKEGRCGVRWVFTSQCGLSAPKQSDAGISTERQPSMWCQYPRRVRGGRGLAKHRDSGPEWGENCVQGGMGRKGGHGLGVLVHRVRRESRFRSGRHTV